ncbi:MAG: ABC transporter permease [Planctomycetota bacterium]
MLGQLLAIARNTFLESIRQPIFLVLVLASGILQVFNVAISAYSMGYTEQTEVSGDDKFLLEVGLATVLGLATLLSAFLATSVLTREIENKTALTVVSKPVSRPLFVVGKYLGVAAAIGVATIIMLVWFQVSIRHGVMSTARDRVDGPVVVFSVAAALLSVGLGTWCNYFYGMIFASTAVFSLLPLSLVAWLGVHVVSKDWAWQAFTTDFKPQITIACLSVFLAMLVLTALAVAMSTRLKQVMTITVCASVFVLGLLSNYFVGSRAFINVPAAQILEVRGEPRLGEGERFTFREPGESLELLLGGEPKEDFRVGDPVYYGPSPNGIGMLVPSQPATFDGDPASPDDTFRWDGPPALVVSSWDAESQVLGVVNAGGIDVDRPPTDNRPEDALPVQDEQRQIDEGNLNQGDARRPNTRITEIKPEGDYVFTRPTEVNPVALGAWSLIPNMQSFWLTDAISQGHAIPVRYIALLLGYTMVQVAGMLALAVLLFQGRDMG